MVAQMLIQHLTRIPVNDHYGEGILIDSFEAHDDFGGTSTHPTRLEPVGCVGQRVKDGHHNMQQLASGDMNAQQFKDGYATVTMQAILSKWWVTPSNGANPSISLKSHSVVLLRRITPPRTVLVFDFNLRTSPLGRRRAAPTQPLGLRLC